MGWPPEDVYAVERFTDAEKPYYGRSDKRLYGHERHVRQWIDTGGIATFKVFWLDPYNAQWNDVTHKFM